MTNEAQLIIAPPVVDPMYHNSGELTLQTFLCVGSLRLIGPTGDISDRENYDLDQVKSIAKVEVRCSCFMKFQTGAELFLQFATLLHAAGFDLQAP
jgi:hypothetical protein